MGALRLTPCIWQGGPQDGQVFATGREIPSTTYTFKQEVKYLYVPLLGTNGASVKNSEGYTIYTCVAWHDTLSGIKSEFWLDTADETE